MSGLTRPVSAVTGHLWVTHAPGADLMKPTPFEDLSRQHLIGAPHGGTKTSAPKGAQPHKLETSYL